MNEEELAATRRRHAVAHHNSKIEDIHPSEEQAAFWVMLFEDRAPRAIRQQMSTRFLQERIVAPELARQAAAAAC